MRFGIALFALSVVAIATVWAWLGEPIAMPNAPLGPGEKLYCVSYSPFRGEQTPADPTTHIDARQIEDDLARLAKLTDCVRTYSLALGVDQVPAIARRHGLKVMLGIWLSTEPDKTRAEIETGIKLANQYPDVIRALIVGNEVLLRGEMSALDLAGTIRTIKARVHVPVTYADVWEFWLRNVPLASAVDFVTIHILPYWEDFPIPARDAASHVDSIRQRVAKAFPGKEIMIGEVGWPSFGRMRDGARPSPANQARVIQDVLAIAKRNNFRVNVIEAFDEPWKRLQEGTVGAHWGLLDANAREFKFQWGKPVSNHPFWIWQAIGGIAFAAAIFGAAIARARGRVTTIGTWIAIGVMATTGGVLIGWAFVNVPLESFGLGGWIRSIALAAVALVVPPAVAAAMVADVGLPRLSQITGPAAGRVREPLPLVLGAALAVLIVLAIQVALGLVFDPRYRDFPFAPFTCAVVPLFLHSLIMRRPAGARGMAEMIGAGMLGLSAVYIVLNETFANWQSLWLCAAFATLAITLVRVRGERS
ncbi:MAG: beta-(1-6) glucans synthase [Pseudolabrys sp.]